jgi:hypothetical protein
MPSLNARQVKFRKVLEQGGQGNYTTLQDYIERVRFVPQPVLNAQVLTVTSVDVTLVDSSILSGVIAVGSSSTQYDGGVCAAILPGAVGTASLATVLDDAGNIANKVFIQKADTHDPITTNGREVFGLLQCSSTVSDGDSIGAAASENIQISFVYYNSTRTLTAVALNTTFEFGIHKTFVEANLPNKLVLGAGPVPDVISKTIEVLSRVFTVTTAFAANEVITITTGAGAASGVSTIETGSDDIVLPASEAEFKARKELIFELNGVKIRKLGSSPGVVYDTTNSFHIDDPLDVGDVITIIDETSIES